MKKRTAFAAALLAALMIATMCLTACGSKNNEPDPAVTENSTLTAKDGTIGGALEDGTYKMTKLYISGKESAWVLSAMQELV